MIGVGLVTLLYTGLRQRRTMVEREIEQRLGKVLGSMAGPLGLCSSGHLSGRSMLRVR